MKNSILVIVPIVIAAVFYLFWPAEQNNEKIDSVTTSPQTNNKQKIKIVSEEKLTDTGKESSQSQNTPSDSGKVANTDGKRSQQSSQKSVAKYVEMTGVSQEFYDLDAMLDSQIEQIVASSELSEDDKEQITRIFSEHIKGEDLLAAYKAELAIEFSEEELEALGELNNDPLIRKVREDNPTNDPNIGQQVSEYFAEIEKNPVSPERQEIVKEIALATKGADFIVDISQTMMDNLGKHLGAKGDAPTPEEMQTFREQLKEQAEFSVMSGLLFQTRNLNDEEAELYKKNQTHPLAQRDQNIRKGVAKRVTGKMYSEIGKVGMDK